VRGAGFTIFAARVRQVVSQTGKHQWRPKIL
jgi:hypothetical protein